ncbi:hypothetical protein SAY87_027812 [Trapa incisa]|uniref:beta-glucosidase n=1 Tax=Trapa incisa TaxID=236973 RepID=A0AAN7PKX3_9MYRT|nr:hypothetical protein SAY87_027812 [Trapa incisa]
MLSFTSFSWVVVLLLWWSVTASANHEESFSRYDFPPGFVFGSGTSAYQVEGAVEEDGRTPSIWDTFAHAGYIHGATGDVACDGYHKYKEDVQLMVETGLDAYRFSISWSRLIPHGRGPVNPKGLQYYNNLINELIKHGIQPHVTLFNFDHPQELEDEYGGWVSRRIVKDFTAYAEVCFREFGDRVRYWVTINEPNVFSIGGYDIGISPPRRCSPPFGFSNCLRGNSSSEPYLAVHNILLSHASAAKLYREVYQVKQLGFIGINVYTFGILPLTNSTEDVVAAKRANEFLHGWVVNPLIFGDYPEIMKKNVGERLPKFTPLQSKEIMGSVDFLGLIHYTTMYIKDKSSSLIFETRDFNMDMAVDLSLWDISGASEVPFMPWGLTQVLELFKQEYGNPPIFIYENGQRTERNTTLQDTGRVKCIQAYMGAVLDAVRNGSDTRGYFTWSFLDLFELLDGYGSSYGHYYVDLDDPDLRRYPKLSAHWYSNFLKGEIVGLKEDIEMVSGQSRMDPRKA